MINVHPSLLPAFPGIGAIEQALAYGVKVFGVTVHFVDAGVDTGPVILQRAIELPEPAGAEEVLAALRPLEHALLPQAVRLFAGGALRPTRPTRAGSPPSRRRPRRGIGSGHAPRQRARDGGGGVERAAPGEVRVRRALLSVSDKRGLVEFARGLRELGVEIVSTGGTARELAEAGIAVRSIEDFTGFPEIMDGRVKTLHPRLYAGLLARRDDAAHLRAAAEQAIEQVDLVCVNLYPFEQTVARGDAAEQEAIENIDIGGPTMIRAAAKNSDFAAVVVDPADYEPVLAELRESGGRLGLATRQRLAAAAFASTARYDAAIAAWFAARQGADEEGFPPTLSESSTRSATCATARTPTSGRPSTPAPGRRRTCSTASASCTARSCRSTTCSTSARRASWSRTSTGRPARSSSTTTRAAAPSARASSRPTNGPSRAIRRAPTAA